MLSLIIWLLSWSFLHSLSDSEWVSKFSECPGCKQYVSSTNFTSIISFESKVLLGAKNSIYQIDFSEETSQRFDDKTRPSQFEACSKIAGQSVEDCQNYYKVILRLNTADLFICGTSAFSPICAVRTKDDLSYSTHTSDGIGICPANPASSTTYLKLKDSHFGFAGTERGSSSEYVISRINLKAGSYSVQAETKSDTFWLNKPEFIYSFEHGEHVYFILKEIAVEMMNIEQIYSRIVRICKEDKGTDNIFMKENFTTFLKARLFCSYTKPGQSPYDFNEIGGAYFLDGYLYGLFSGPSSVIETGSVLCRYSIEDITKAFEGKCKYYAMGGFHDEDRVYHFTCESGRDVTQALKHQLVSSPVSSDEPIHYSSLKMKSLAVSSVTVGNESSIVTHAGSMLGYITRIGFKETGDSLTVRWREFNLGKGPITALSLEPGNVRDIFVMSHNWAGYIPLHSECSQFSTCQDCQTAFPSCGWCYSSDTNTCTSQNQCTGSWSSPYSHCPKLPVFALRPQNKTVTLDDKTPKDQKLRCSGKSRDIVPHWSKARGQINSNSEISEDGKELNIKVDSYTDSGVYICSLIGAAGTVSVSVTLSVKIKPEFTLVSPANVSVQNGLDVTLECRATGYPSPVTKWFKRGSKLPVSARMEENGDLKIIRTMYDDAGVYHCEIENGVGQPLTQRSSDIKLSVISSEPGREATTDQSKRFSGTLLIVGICSGFVFLIVVALITHYCIQQRKQQRVKVQQILCPISYQEQNFTDYPHTPTSVISPTPDYLSDHQAHFEWGQQIMQHGPSQMLVPQLMEEEPPPAYHAEIELHNPPGRRPPPHIPYSAEAPSIPARHHNESPSYYPGERGLTPISRTTIQTSSPGSSGACSAGSSGQPAFSEENMAKDDTPMLLPAATLPDQRISSHEYELIGIHPRSKDGDLSL